MIIRQELPEDIDDIRAINEKAFGQPQEAIIVDKLRQNCDELLSPPTIEGQHGVIKGMGLAPMAVLPEMQRRGIGSQLVKAGLEQLSKAKCPFVIVLGHPGYYPRFGFEPASRYGIKSPWKGVPDNVFMILWFNKSIANQVSGVAGYRDEFNDAV